MSMAIWLLLSDFLPENDLGKIADRSISFCLRYMNYNLNHGIPSNKPIYYHLEGGSDILLRGVNVNNSLYRE